MNKPLCGEAGNLLRSETNKPPRAAGDEPLREPTKGFRNNSVEELPRADANLGVSGVAKAFEPGSRDGDAPVGTGEVAPIAVNIRY